MQFKKYFFDCFEFSDFYYLDLLEIAVFLSNLKKGETYIAQPQIWNNSCNKVVVLSFPFVIDNSFSPKILLEFLESRIRNPSSNLFIYPYDQFKFNPYKDYSKNNIVLRIKFESINIEYLTKI